MFDCVHLGLASQKERRQHLIILHVWIIIFSEFLDNMLVMHVIT